MERLWKLSLVSLIALVATCLLSYLVVSHGTPLSPSLLVRSVKSPLYSEESFGTALLTLTNGSGQDVFFQTGQHHVLGLIWFAVERKRGATWVVESQATEWTPKEVIVATGVNRWPPGKVLDFRVTLPADGQTRRIAVRWKPVPRKVPAIFRRLQDLWWRKRALKRSTFVELRSPDMIVAAGSPRFDFEAATKRLHTNETQPGRIEGTSGFLDGVGLNYSTGGKPLTTK
jgi:hypothetical protein